MYAYVQNDPVNWVDPEGLTKKDIYLKTNPKYSPNGNYQAPWANKFDKITKNAVSDLIGGNMPFATPISSAGGLGIPLAVPARCARRKLAHRNQSFERASRQPRQTASAGLPLSRSTRCYIFYLATIPNSGFNFTRLGYEPP